MAATKTFTLKIDGIETSIKNTQELTDTVERLKAEFEGADFGSQKYAVLQRELQKANSEVERIEQSIEKFTPEQKFQTIGAVVGTMGSAFGLVTATASQFGEQLGLSEEQVKAYEDSINNVQLAVTSVIGIGQAFTGENLKNIKSLFASTLALKGQVQANRELGVSTSQAALATEAQTLATGQGVVATETATVATKSFGVAVKVALASLLIPLIIAGLYTIYENWDKVKQGAIDFYNYLKDSPVAPLLAPIILSVELIDKVLTKLKANFGSFGELAKFLGGAIGKVFSNLGKVLTDLRNGEFRQAIQDAGSLGEGVEQAANEGREKVQVKARLSALKDRAEELQARKDDYFKDLEVLEKNELVRLGKKRQYEAVIYKLLKDSGQASEQELREQGRIFLTVDNEYQQKREEGRQQAAKLAQEAEAKRQQQEFTTFKASLERKQELTDKIDAGFKEDTGEDNPTVIQGKLDTSSLIEQVDQLTIPTPVKVPLTLDTSQERLEGVELLGARINASLTEAGEGGSFSESFINGLLSSDALANGLSGGKLLSDLAFIEEAIFTTLQEARFAELETQLSQTQTILDAAKEASDALAGQLDESQNRIDELEGKLLGAKGLEREQIIAQLEVERARNRQIAEDKKKEDERAKRAENEKLAIEQKRTKEQEKQTKIQGVLNALDAVSASIAATRAAFESVKAIASAGSGGKFGFDNIAYILAATAAIAGAFIAVKGAAKGFAEGGYTGPGDKYEAAGVVHKGEYVIPAWMVASPTYSATISTLENSRTRGYAEGGFVAPQPSQGLDTTVLVGMQQELISLRQATNAALSKPIYVSHSEYRQHEATTLQVREHFIN